MEIQRRCDAEFPSRHIWVLLLDGDCTANKRFFILFAYYHIKFNIHKNSPFYCLQKGKYLLLYLIIMCYKTI